MNYNSEVDIKEETEDCKDWHSSLSSMMSLKDEHPFLR
jgi:hypothetical protein